MAGQKIKQNQRITQVVRRNPGGREATPAGRIMLSPETATVVRALAKHAKLTLDDLVQRMLQDYIPRHHPELDMVLDDGTARTAVHRTGDGILGPSTVGKGTLNGGVPDNKKRF